MSKYDPLQDHLSRKDLSEIPMNFEEIEALISAQLPPSARKYRAWWSNNPSNSVMTYAWLNAGYRTAQVNLEGERVVFVRVDRAAAPKRDRTKSPIGGLAGLVTVHEGTDLTAPADPDWGKVYE